LAKQWTLIEVILLFDNLLKDDVETALLLEVVLLLKVGSLELSSLMRMMTD